MNLVDPEGNDWYIFDLLGQFLRKEEHPGTHLLALYSLDDSGKPFHDCYDFADPINDPKAIDDGIIDRIQLVTDNEIYSMIEQNDGFSVSQVNFVWNSRGDKPFDYSAHVLFDKYKISHSVHKTTDGLYVSKALYLPEGERVAHNYMNFGNFLWAINGYSIGIGRITLQTGAHINSLMGPRGNGYPAQFDSKDDQFSIIEGVKYAKSHTFRSLRSK